MAGIDYRQLQSPVGVNTDLPDSGNAARAAELRRAFQEFEGISSDIYTKSAIQAGAVAGAASGNTGHPDYKKGLSRFTAYGQAFNNAATGAYAVEAEAQADDAAARLRVQANNDPATFNATYGAVRDAVLKTAPAQAQPMLAELYNKRLAAGMAAISGDQATEIRATQRAAYDEGVARQTSRVATLQGSDNPVDQAAAEDEHVKLSLLIDGGYKAGLYSKAESESMHIAAMRTITSQVFSTQVDHELLRPDGDVVKLLDNFRAAHEKNIKDTSQPPILSEPEYQKLMSDATTKIREQRLLDLLTKGEAKTAEQIKFEAGDAKYSELLVRGQLTDGMLANAVHNHDLKPETMRALHTQLANGPVLKSDPKAFLSAMQDPGLPGMSPTEIAVLPNISNADKVKLGTEGERQRNNWEGTQQVKTAISGIQVALKVPPGSGALVSDDQKLAAANAVQDFKTRMAALPPEQRLGSADKIAQEVIQAQHQKEAVNEVQMLQRLRDSALKNHGPGSADEWSKEKMKAYTDTKDAAIAAASARAKGQ